MEQFVVVIWGLVEVLKKAGLNSKYLPLCAVLIGALMGGVSVWGMEAFFVDGVIKGAMWGLISTGIVGMVDGRLAKTKK